jgi:hypothetical protein
MVERTVYIYIAGTVIIPTYIKCCKILSRDIKEAKRQYYCRLIVKSDNQIKTTWNIIKHETGKLHLTEQIPSLLIKEKSEGPSRNC